MSKFEESNFYKALQDFFINADKKTFLQFLAEFYNRTEGIIDKDNIQDDLIKELRELYLEFNEKGIDENIVREKVNYFLENSSKINNIIAKLNINTNNIKNIKSQLNTNTNNIKNINSQLNTNTNNIKNINSQLEHIDLQKAEKDELKNVQAQVNNLVLNNAGDSNSEVVQARTSFTGDIFPTLKSNIDSIEEFQLTGIYKKSFGDWTQGAVQHDGQENINSKYIRTGDFHTFNKEVKLSVSDNYKYRISKYDTSGTILNTIGFTTNTILLLPEENVKYKFSLGKNDDTDILTNEGSNLIIIEDRNIRYNEYGASFIENGENVVSTDTLIKDTVINAMTGEEESSVAYVSTDFIPFCLNKSIYVGRYRNYNLYDINKQRITGNATETITDSEIKITNDEYSHIAYIRFSIRVEYSTTFFASYKENNNKKYGIYIDKLRIEKKNLDGEVKKFIENAYTKNPLSNKTVYSFGDSLLAGHYSGEGMIDGLVAENNMKYTKYATNGHTICGDGTTSILNQINNAPSTPPDFVIFDGLTNDAYDNIANNVGTISPSFKGGYGTNDFTASFETICYTLRNKYVDSNIIYIAPHKMSSRSKNAQDILQARAKEICNKWSIPVVDIYNEGQINCYIDSMRIKYSYDNAGETDGGNGTHLTGKGYNKWYKPLIESKMLELI